MDVIIITDSEGEKSYDKHGEEIKIRKRELTVEILDDLNHYAIIKSEKNEADRGQGLIIDKNQFEQLKEYFLNTEQKGKKDIIDYIEHDAEIAMPINELMHESGRSLSKKEYGKVLLKYLVIELRSKFNNT
jgi:hypothetical protein